MTDHGQQHEQGDYDVWGADFGKVGAADREMVAKATSGRIASPEVLPQFEQGDTLRAAQIQAVRDVLGWPVTSDDTVEERIIEVAAEVVDAVLAAGGICGALTGPLPFDIPTDHCVLPHGHPGDWHQANSGMRWRPAQDGDARDQAHAAGYAQAVANCRDDAGYDAWARTQPHSWTRADYLEAIGPQKDQKLTEEDRGWRVGRHLGRTLYCDGELQGLLDDPALAQRIADVLNAEEASGE